MRKLFLTLGMFIATVAFLVTTGGAETVAIKKVIQVPGSTKAQLFDKVQTWADKYARDHKDDFNSGIITANGEVAYPSPPVDRIQYSFPFKMKNTIQGDKVTVTFEEVMLKSPKTYLPADTGAGPAATGGTMEPLKSKKDIVAANKMMNYITDNLGDYLLGKTETACPLVKCPECALLCPSPEEMKEHMKTHGGQEPAPKE